MLIVAARFVLGWVLLNGIAVALQIAAPRLLGFVAAVAAFGLGLVLACFFAPLIAFERFVDGA